MRNEFNETTNKFQLISKCHRTESCSKSIYMFIFDTEYKKYNQKNNNLQRLVNVLYANWFDIPIPNKSPSPKQSDSIWLMYLYFICSPSHIYSPCSCMRTNDFDFNLFAEFIVCTEIRTDPYGYRAVIVDLKKKKPCKPPTLLKSPLHNRCTYIWRWNESEYLTDAVVLHLRLLGGLMWLKSWPG